MLFSLDRRGDLDLERDLEFDLDLDRELELLERDLEPLSDREEWLLDLDDDDDDDDDEVLSLCRFFLLGGDCDLDLERRPLSLVSVSDSSRAYLDRSPSSSSSSSSSSKLYFDKSPSSSLSSSSSS